LDSPDQVRENRLHDAKHWYIPTFRRFWHWNFINSWKIAVFLSANDSWRSVSSSLNDLSLFVWNDWVSKLLASLDSFHNIRRAAKETSRTRGTITLSPWKPTERQFPWYRDWWRVAFLRHYNGGHT
jgi:hypothetical protein